MKWKQISNGGIRVVYIDAIDKDGTGIFDSKSEEWFEPCKAKGKVIGRTKNSVMDQQNFLKKV